MAARLPPQSIEAEQAVIGSLLLDSEAWDSVSDILKWEDFYKPSHQHMYKCIEELVKAAQPVDLITLTNWLTSKNLLETVGGSSAVVEILSKTISSANVASYAKIIKDKALLRSLIHKSTDIIERAYQEDGLEASNLLDEAESEIYKLSDMSVTEGLVGPLDVVKSSIARIEDLYKRKAEVTGLSSGFTVLDKMTSGFQAGELGIIAARPSMGKTAFSLNLATHIALRQAKTVAYFSCEMGRDAVMMRVLASESRINVSNIRSGRIPDAAWPKLIQVAGQVGDSGLFIDETTGISPMEVRARARRLKASRGLDIIIIDYLQMMRLKQKVDNREREVSEISNSLKSLAKELKIPVIALAQLNRSVEGRSDRRPMLSDLRESGSIEQDADIIMMLYRDDYYDRDDAEKQGAAEVIIAKQRNGPTGSVKLRWDAEFGRFRDAEPDSGHPLPPPVPSPNQTNYPRKNFAPGASV